MVLKISLKLNHHTQGSCSHTLFIFGFRGLGGWNRADNKRGLVSSVDPKGDLGGSLIQFLCEVAGKAVTEEEIERCISEAIVAISSK